MLPICKEINHKIINLYKWQIAVERKSKSRDKTLKVNSTCNVDEIKFTELIPVYFLRLCTWEVLTNL